MRRLFFSVVLPFFPTPSLLPSFSSSFSFSRQFPPPFLLRFLPLPLPLSPSPFFPPSPLFFSSSLLLFSLSLLLPSLFLLPSLLFFSPSLSLLTPIFLRFLSPSSAEHFYCPTEKGLDALSPREQSVMLAAAWMGRAGELTQREILAARTSGQPVNTIMQAFSAHFDLSDHI